MTVLADLVADYGLTIEEFADRLRRELAAADQGDVRALSDADRSVLATIGISAVDLDGSSDTDPVPAAADILRDAQQTVTTAGMATALGRSESRIRGAIADGSLYGVRIGRAWQLPVWQIHDGRPLPHLRKVIAAIPNGVSPAVLGRVMATPTDELVLDAAAVTPRTWLLAGGDPEPVVALVAALLLW